MGDVHVTVDHLMPDAGAIGRVRERLPAGHGPAAQDEGQDERYPLRQRLWIIVGSAAATWGVAWLGGLALLHAVGLR